MTDGDDGRSITTFQDIPGWFNPIDKFVFDTLLSNQPQVTGALVELGAYMGRSTVVIADHRRPDERMVVVDLFGSDAGLGDDREDRANRLEFERSYTTLSKQRFEANFLALHPELPEVVMGLSSVVVDHVEPGTVRFAHIDASHMYDKVREDIANVRRLLAPGGIVVLDDYRSPHTPGVAAATWEAVADGLKPIAITEAKFYGTWDDPEPYQAAVTAAVGRQSRLVADPQPLREHTLIRIVVPKATQRAEAKAERDRLRSEAMAKGVAKGEARATRRATERQKKKDQARAAREKQQAEAARRAEKAAARALAAKRAAEPLPTKLARAWAPPVVVAWARKHRSKPGRSAS